MRKIDDGFQRDAPQDERQPDLGPWPVQPPWFDPVDLVWVVSTGEVGMVLDYGERWAIGDVYRVLCNERVLVLLRDDLQLLRPGSLLARP